MAPAESGPAFTAEPAVIKGEQKTWGFWERLVPTLIPDDDAPMKRMIDIHVRRYETAMR